MGDRAIYSCETGYNLNGTSFVTCEGVQGWTNSSTPTCDIADCGGPPGIVSDPLSTLETCSSFVYQGVCNYTCVTGFQPVGTNVYTCTRFGNWSVEFDFFCSDTSVEDSVIDIPPNGLTFTAGTSVDVGLLALDGAGSPVITGQDILVLSVPGVYTSPTTTHVPFTAVYNVTINFDAGLSVATTYTMDIILNEVVHPRSPFIFTIEPAAADPATTVVTGAVLTQGSFSGEPVDVTVEVRDEFENTRVGFSDKDLITFIPKQGSQEIPSETAQSGPGLYTSVFTPNVGGLYTISISIDGMPHPSSPWVVVVSARCLPGTQSLDESTCADCPANTFSETINADLCELCPANMRSPDLSSSWTNCTCNSGFWIGTQGHVRGRGCFPCPRGGVCVGDLLPPVAAEDFFDVSSNSDGSAFEQCRRPGACAGGREKCSRGYEGFMCNTCSSNHYSDSAGACRECPPGSSGLMVAFIMCVVGTAIGVIVFMVFTYAGEATAIADGQGSHVTPEMRYTRGAYSHRRRVPHSFSQAIVFAQILGVIAKSSLSWPSQVQDTLLAFNVINLDLDLFASECSLSSFEAKYALSTLYPVAFLLIATLAWIVLKSVRYSFSRLRQLPALDAPTLIVLERTVILIAPLLYIPLSRSSLILFDCSRLADGNYYLDQDLGRKCFDSRWFRILPLGLWAVFVYVIGIPLYIGYGLYRYRNRLSEPSILGRFGSVYRLYRAAYFWCELPLLLKRLVIVLASLYFSNAQIWQVATLLALFAVATVLHSQHEPYYEPLYNKLELRLNICSSAILSFGFAFYADRFPNRWSEFIFIALCILVILVAVIILLTTFLVELKAIWTLYKNPDAEFELDVKQLEFWKNLERDAPDWVNKELVEHLLSFRGELNEKQRAKLKLDTDAVPVSIGIDNSLSLITSLDSERPTSRQHTVAPGSAAGPGDSAGAAGVASAAPAASSSRAAAARSSTFHGSTAAPPTSMTANLDSSSEEEYAIKLDDLGPASQQTYATRNIFDDVDDDIVV